MRRFTILGLMGLVLGAAVAVAALRNADDYWAGGLLLGTVLLIATGTLGAFYHSGHRRANRLGFVVFAGGYFTLVFLGLSDQNLAKLPTTWLLLYVHQRVAPPQTFISYVVQPAVQGTTVISSVNPSPVANTFTVTPTSPLIVTGAANGNPRTRWSSLLPGAANYEAFGVVGHCLFALVAGLLGMVIARRYQAKQDQDEQGNRGMDGPRGERDNRSEGAAISPPH